MVNLELISLTSWPAESSDERAAIGESFLRGMNLELRADLARSWHAHQHAHPVRLEGPHVSQGRLATLH
jgi:hypothetical protein